MAAKRVNFTRYDAASRFDTIIRYANLAGTQLVVTTDYMLDNGGGLTGLTHKKGTTLLADYDFTFDAASRLTETVSSADGTSTYVLRRRDTGSGRLQKSS